METFTLKLSYTPFHLEKPTRLPGDKESEPCDFMVRPDTEILLCKVRAPERAASSHGVSKRSCIRAVRLKECTSRELSSQTLNCKYPNWVICWKGCLISAIPQPNEGYEV